MKKRTLDERVNTLKSETRDALQTLYDNLVPGQKKQIIKAPEVKALFDRYGVEYDS